MTFQYIRHKLQKFKKIEILDKCYTILQINKNKNIAMWDIFLLMKWAYLYAEERYPLKEFTDKDFSKILNAIPELSEDHMGQFFKFGGIKSVLQIYSSQQLYLKQTVHTIIFASQLKLYNSIIHKYEIEKSFIEKTGISVFDFIKLSHLTYLYINSSKLGAKSFFGDGVISENFWKICIRLSDKQVVEKYQALLTLNPLDCINQIKDYKRSISKEELQSFETTFFTMYPFQIHNGKLRLPHRDIFNYTVNYFIHDFLKMNDNLFGSEFGKRFEKYIALSFQEINMIFKSENDLKKLLPKDSNVPDFMIPTENIFIECKAIELQPYTSVNPSNERVLNNLKGSIMKAYYKQLLTAATTLKNGCENWGIILTYKQLFWSKFSDLWEISKNEFMEDLNSESLPPENVFIIDFLTWNEIIQIIKDKKATLSNILRLAKMNNSNPNTSKLFFLMHLDRYFPLHFDFKFLDEEFNSLK